MEPAATSAVLSIVIPALNEEEAIANTISRCLAARAEIAEAGGLRAVEVIMVNDGSTDRTSEIAHGFAEVKVIDFARNRGYGAAIKEGFREASGSLVGFLDADGTCDPRYFAPMCRIAMEDGADMVLGSRLGPDSKMPGIRRLGNRIYAFLLGVLCGQHVTDTASGMRVVRRSALDLLYPLPDGLHFTPSMSARALFNGLHVVEIPVRYEERVGTSKLRVLQDGVQFLRTIFADVLCYRPERLLLMGFSLCLIFSVLLGTYPLEFYLQHRMIEEWMIYRFVVCSLLGAWGFLLLCATALSWRMADLGRPRRRAAPFWPALIARSFDGKFGLAFIGITTAISLALEYPGISEYFRTGHVTMHWSRAMVGAFGLLIACQSAITYVLLQVLAIWKAQRVDQINPARRPSQPPFKEFEKVGNGPRR
jgi:glycosyltransferase involved in cell wall biosynthesis